MFMATLVTKKVKEPSIGAPRDRENVVCSHNSLFISRCKIKKNVIGRKMDGAGDHHYFLSKISQAQKCKLRMANGMGFPYAEFRAC